MMGSLNKVNDFICGQYSGDQTMESRVEGIDIKEESMSCCDEFCYVCDMTGAEGGAETTCIRSSRSSVN